MSGSLRMSSLYYLLNIYERVLSSQMLHLAKKVYLWELVLLASDKLLAQDSQAS